MIGLRSAIVAPMPPSGVWATSDRLLALTASHASRAELVALPIKAISLTFDPVTINLPGVGPVSTGPITATLQGNRRSYALFDTTSGQVQTDQFLQFDFPLLRAIGGPADAGVPGDRPRDRRLPTEDRSICRPGEPARRRDLRSGSILSSATLLVNDSTNIFGAVNPPIPSPPPCAVPYPGPFTPFSPGSVPDAPALPAGFRPATGRQIRALLAKSTMVRSSFSIGGFLRVPGQAGDIPFGGMGQLGPSYVTAAARSWLAPGGRMSTATSH